jgi:hypothetical protein
VKVRRTAHFFRGAQNPRVKTSSATLLDKGGAGIRQRSFAMTTVMYKLRRGKSSAESACLPLKEEGAEHG